jgi:hypothetical protein
MSRRTQLWLGFLALGVAAIAFLVLAEQCLNRVQSALEVARQRQASVERESQRLEREDSARQSHALARNGAPGSIKSEATPKAAPASAVRKLDGPVAALVQSPQLQAQYLEAKRARIERAYGPLFKSLNLSADQIARFGSIVMQREEQALDIAGAVPAALHSSFSDGQWFTGSLSLSVGGPASDPDTQAAAKLLQQANQGFQDAATGLLGPDGYHQLVDYQRAMPMRGVVDDLAGSLATSSSPLNPDQANQLVQILASASASYGKGRTATLSPIDWDQALQGASGVLSSPQMASLNEVIAMRHAQDQLRDLVKTATGAAQ